MNAGNFRALRAKSRMLVVWESQGGRVHRELYSSRGV